MFFAGVVLGNTRINVWTVGLVDDIALDWIESVFSNIVHHEDDNALIWDTVRVEDLIRVADISLTFRVRKRRVEKHTKIMYNF